MRVGYREPNNLDLCAHDLACGVETARDAGAERVVLFGHSFGGAAAIRAAVVMPASVVGVVTFATQSAGCEVAGALGGKPLLLFHGDRDELLPPDASYMVQAIAGSGEVVILPGDGHVLARSDAAITERLDEWLPPVLGLGSGERRRDDPAGGQVTMTVVPMSAKAHMNWASRFDCRWQPPDSFWPSSASVW